MIFPLQREVLKMPTVSWKLCWDIPIVTKMVGFFVRHGHLTRPKEQSLGHYLKMALSQSFFMVEVVR